MVRRRRVPAAVSSGRVLLRDHDGHARRRVLLRAVARRSWRAASPPKYCLAYPSGLRPHIGHSGNARRSTGRDFAQLGEIKLCGTGRHLDVPVPAAMSLARQVFPGEFYLITRRCTQRQFLLRPDPATNNAFTYCLIEAAQRCQIDIVLPCAMSKHHHTVIFDRHGRYSEFVEQFHKMLARSQNALRGRWENLWSSKQACVVLLVGREDVMQKLVYTAVDPVKDHLVDRVHHWPGVNGLHALLTARPLRA